MLALLLLTAVVLLVAFAIHKQKLRMGEEGLPFLGPFFDALVPTVAPLTPPSSPASLDLISTPPTKSTKQSPLVGSDSLASTQVDVSPSLYEYDHLQSTESPADFAPPPAVVEPVSVRLVDQVDQYDHLQSTESPADFAPPPAVVEPVSVRLVDQVDQYDHLQSTESPADFTPPPAVVEPVSVRLVDQLQTVVEPVSVRLVDQVQTEHVGDQTAPEPIPIHSEDAPQPDGYEPPKVIDFPTKIVDAERVPEPTPVAQETTGSSRRHRHNRRSTTADGSKQSDSSRRHRRHHSHGGAETDVEATQPTEPEVTADSAPAAEPITYFTIKPAEDKSSAPPEAASAGQDNKGSSRHRHHRRSSTADGKKRSGSSRRRHRHRSQGDEAAVVEGNKQPESADDGAPAAEPIRDFKIKLAEDKPKTAEATGAPPAAEKLRHRHRSRSTGGRRGSKRSSSRRHRTKDGTAGEAVAVVKDSSNLAQEAGNQDAAGASDQQQRRHRRRSASDRSRRGRHSTSNADAAVQDSSGAQLSKDATPEPLQQDAQ